jgi:pectate lyase
MEVSFRVRPNPKVKNKRRSYQMKKKVLGLLGVAILLIAFQAMVGAAVVFTEDFQDGNSSGWGTSNGSWSVVNDGTYVYKQSSLSTTAHAYNGTSTWANYSVETRVKALSFNGTARYFGIGARYSGTSSYYSMVLLNTNRLELRKRVSGANTTLAGKSYTVTTGTWYTLKLVVNGTSLQAYVNGVLELSATDSSLRTGKLLLTTYNASAEFDDISVDNLGGTISTPTPTVPSSNTPTPTRVVSNTPTPTRIIGPTPTSDGSVPPVGSPIGWASVNGGTTGGAGGPVIHVYDKDTLDDVLYQDDNPAIIVIHGNLTGGPAMNTNVKSNKTIIGAGNGASLNFGLYLRGSNIIIKNLDIMNGGFEAGDSEGLDAVTFAQDCQHIWVDHCTMHETRDGLVDPTRNARFVTISYCYFHTQKTAVLIGASDSDSHALSAQSSSDKRNWDYTVTVCNNYWSGCYERCPRVRFGAVHVFNNYFDSNPNYAIGRGDRANIYSENNYFYNTHDAFAAYDDSSNPGYVEDVGSLFEGDNGNTTDNPPSGTYVWTPSQYYSYPLQSAAWVKANLKNYCGVGKGNP